VREDEKVVALARVSAGIEVTTSRGTYRRPSSSAPTALAAWCGAGSSTAAARARTSREP
jgi:hypothetical protein